jgi:hypothetical protein
MRYVTPDLEGNTLAYRGRRYWLVELSPGGCFQCVDTTVADYVVFDRLYDAPVGRVSRDPDGGFEVSTIMGFAGPDYAPTLREAVQLAARLTDEECRALM